MLKVEHVSAGYGKQIRVLEDVSINVDPKEVVVVVGPNGSGKSTLLRTIFGLTTLYTGAVSLDGKVLTALTPHERAKAGLAYLPQRDNVFPDLTVAENFTMACYDVPKREYGPRVEQVMQSFPQLTNYVASRVSDLSGGERQMVAMAMAMLRRPRVVLFDEPTANLAPKIATQVLNRILSLAKDEGLAVVLAEQNATRALELGDRAYLLVSGSVNYEGGAQDLLHHKELGKLYLGLD